ncbi:MAG: DUF262 domain-containing protein [Selenomonadaceae bacterium]|nr:DUF262 domain-containing protein [Selenomonadaceae bacterium]
MSNAKLETRLVNEIEGKFFVPSYQRGYRWGTDEVTRLLDDVYNLLNFNSGKNPFTDSKNYCLQPIVVKKLGENYFEVIDGQQRLTTLFLIYAYMYEVGGNFFDAPKFSLSYKTRKKSETFLAHIEENLNLRDENIDFHFMANAYTAIKNWFEMKKNIRKVTQYFASLFEDNVKIIWYEVDDTSDGNAMFTRLNIGKIPLTSAELVKAMFLSSNSMDRRKQDEIALQWDNIEKELHNEAFWYFLTNSSAQKYQTRIDLVLDLKSEKKFGNREKYFTFFYFDRLSKEKNLNEIWREIVQTFLTLKDWYENHNLYHKIGYLIASGYKNLFDIFKEYRGKTKRQFLNRLDELIKASVALKGEENYLNWNYDDDKEKIRRLLLLFNVESVRQNGEMSQWFPFDKFKFGDGGKNSWSLEHINAVKSQNKGTQKDWRQWLDLHFNLAKSVDKSLADEITKALDLTYLPYQKFAELQEKIFIKISPEIFDKENENCIQNLALLKVGDNAALSNSVFDVKRDEIIKLDKKGAFIPFCTKMAFLKYYTQSDKNQIHFWSAADKKNYIRAINEVLKNYLSKPIGKEF